jgi:hypothetical protein
MQTPKKGFKGYRLQPNAGMHQTVYKKAIEFCEKGIHWHLNTCIRSLCVMGKDNIYFIIIIKHP